MQNGIKTAILHCFEGKLEGIQIWFHPNGRICKKGMYVGGRQDGFDSSFYSDGSLERTAQLKAGQFVGTTLEYYPTGHLHSVGKHITFHNRSYLNELIVLSPSGDTLKDSSNYFMLYNTKPPYSKLNRYAFKVVAVSPTKQPLLFHYDFDYLPIDSYEDKIRMPNGISPVLRPRETHPGMNVIKGQILFKDHSARQRSMFFRDTFYLN
jgi:hypothetical protein